MMILLIAKQEVPQTYPPDVLAIRKGKITSLKIYRIAFLWRVIYLKTCYTEGKHSVSHSIFRPCILIFDSLAGPSRNAVIRTLRE